MTYDEYKKTGKSGRYDPDKDEWFIDGEPEAIAAEPVIDTQDVLIEPEPEPMQPATTTKKKGASHE